MYYDYYLLVMQVYDKNYGNATYLSLYQNLHNFQTSCTGGQKFFLAKTKIFSESVHISPYILGCTAFHMIKLFLPLYIYRYMRKGIKKNICSCRILKIFCLVIIRTPMNIFQEVLVY